MPDFDTSLAIATGFVTGSLILFGVFLSKDSL
jgi:hypothetical protein